MVALAVYFSLTIPDYGTLTNALSLMRLFAEFGFVALGMAFSLISGGIDLSVGAIFAFCNFTALFCLFVLGLPVGLVIVATLLTGAVYRRLQRHSDRLSQGAAVSDHTGDADHRARRRQPAERALCHRLRHQFDRKRRLGFPRRRQRSWRPDQRGNADRRSAHRPRLSQPLALRLASDRDRREPQGGAPCRHSCRAHAARDLRPVGHALRGRRHLLRRAPGQHRIRRPASAGNSRR